MARPLSHLLVVLKGLTGNGRRLPELLGREQVNS
jgi:hypothetical protein